MARTLDRRVLDHVRQHPQSTAHSIADALRVSEDDVAWLLRALYRQGAIEESAPGRFIITPRP